MSEKSEAVKKNESVSNESVAPAVAAPLVGLSVEQLQAMLTAVLAEARKPVVTDKEKREMEQAQRDREQQAELIKEQIRNKQAFQHSCTHTRRDGTVRAVYVANGHYMICQACQAIVRPGNPPAGYGGYDIYDTALFNRLFQLSQTEGVFA